MEEAVKQVAEDILIKRPKKDLVHIIFLLGSIVFLLGSILLGVKLRMDSKKDMEIKSDIQGVKAGLEKIEDVVVDGFTSQNKKIDNMLIENDLQHQGINKKLDIFESTLDENRRNQVRLVDELMNIKVTSSVRKEEVIPPIKELESKYEDSYSMSNDIYRELIISHDTIKKNISPQDNKPI